MRESELLAHIYDRSKALPGSFAEVVVGPGDDCAVLRSASGDLTLLSVDQLIEGPHFEPGTPTDRIAYKAFARSISDLAAMGGEPTAALAAAALPDSFQDADALFDAMHRVAADFACPLVGGDIARTTGPLSLTNAIVGTTPMIVFFASMLLAWKTPLLLNETLTTRVVAQKMVAAGMVVSGVVLIALV